MPPAVEAKPDSGLVPDQGEWQPAPYMWPGPLQAEFNERYGGSVTAAPRDLELIPGVHFGPVGGAISGRRRARILGAADALRLDDYLREVPIGPVDFVADLQADDEIVMGRYFREDRAILLNSNRAVSTFGFGFLPVALPSVSNAGETRDRAIGRSFVHEIGHHILHHGLTNHLRGRILAAYQAAKSADSFVSLYAKERGVSEYLCECLVAYRFHSSGFLALDPAGYNTIESILGALREQYRGS